MGKNNQRRRADKKRKEQRRSGRAAAPPPSLDEELQAVVYEGAAAIAKGRPSEAVGAVEALEGAATAFGRLAVTGAVGQAFTRTLISLWEHGWQPHEVDRQMHRRRKAAHVAVLRAAIGSPAAWLSSGGVPLPDAWAAQLVAMDIGTDGTGDWLTPRVATHRPLGPQLQTVLEALSELLRLPPVEPLLDRPSEWAQARHQPPDVSDDPVLAKVRGLLAKAESTEFDAEAEALTAKAQELMARHAIDEAIARRDEVITEEPVGHRVGVDDPYAVPKSHLLAEVASHNGVRTVWYDEQAMMALVGFRSDVEAVEVLFTSLLVQASQAMHRKGSVSDGGGRSRTRSFRQSFLLAFADRVGERLHLATITAQRDAEAELGDRLLPALVSRDERVTEATERLFPYTKVVAGPSINNAEGYRAGRTAAELADLGSAAGAIVDGDGRTG